MPRKVFTAGEVLAAADVNTFLMNQAVMTFSGSAARSSAILSPTEGMVTYLADSDTFQFYNGTAYAPLAPASPTVEYLVIAGGGAGSLRAAAQGAAGGGGAGGYRTNVSGSLSGGSSVAELPMPLVNGTYRITIGAGGTRTTIDNSAGTRGNESIFANIVSIGGAFGATFAREALIGGSGGGHFSNGIGTPPVPQQGFKGGDGNNSFSGAAGGGGAGAAGANVTSNSGSAGGAGLSSSITGSAVTRAGGGGGGGSSGSGGAGGTGGGGAGSIDGNAASAGTANTGSGGGGGENASGGSGNGGSGLVVFSVPTSTTVTFSGGVTQTNATVGSRRVYTVTATSTTSETVTFA
jgi:hypothetical protein